VGQEPGQGLVQLLEQLVLVQQQEQALELVQQQVLEQQSRHRNQQLRLQVSSWHRASKDLLSFSKHHQMHCASCQRIGRQQRLQVLRLFPHKENYEDIK